MGEASVGARSFPRCAGNHASPQISIPSFGEYAASLLQRKVAKGEIKSASSRQKWAETLEHHLVPRFGRIFIDHLRKQDMVAR